VRVLSFEIDPRMIVLLRFGFTSFGLIVAVAILSDLRSKLQFSRPRLHLIRGLCMAISTHLGFYAIANMELVTVTVLFFMVPIFATGLSGFINGEHAGPRRIAAIAASFIGVLLILKPGYQPLNLAVFAALLSSVLFAFALVTSRRLAGADGSFSVLFSSVMITTLFTLPLALPVWQIPQSSSGWMFVAMLVGTGLLRLLADIQAYKLGEASVLAPITYLRLILIGASAYVMFGEVPDRFAVLGTIVIVASALYIARREARLSKAAQVRS
jgi:drug/metabolite transporter (DMT)-like permease